MKDFPKSINEGTLCSNGRVFSHSHDFRDAIDYELELFVNKCGCRTFHGNILNSADGLYAIANGIDGRTKKHRKENRLWKQKV